MVIHEAGSDATQTISAASVLGLHGSFIVHATASGYMDNEGWRLAAEILVKHGGATADHPLFPFYDAHDSHWDPFALTRLRTNHIYPSFLVSNNSTNDQAADMGINASLAAHFDNALDTWTYSHPGEAVDVLVFNVVFTTAWFSFTLNPATPGIIQRAFYKSGWFPLRMPDAANVAAGQLLEQARAGQKWDSGTLESLKSAFRGMGGDKDKMKLKKAEFMPCIASLIAVRIAVPSSGQMPAEAEETVASPAPSPVNSDSEDD
jgi:hypothetical protein